MRLKSRKGQIAIWVIAAIGALFLIGFLFFIGRKSAGAEQAEENPRAFIESCARDSAERAIQKILPNGGFENPEDFISYKKNNITYLCKNTGYFKPCINEHPLLLNEIREEIKRIVYPEIDSCFISVQKELERKGNKVGLEEMAFDVEMAPGLILLKIKREMGIEGRNGFDRFYNFDSKARSSAYELISLAGEITSQEASYCYFEYVGYMLLYPEIDIKKTSLSDSTKIYFLQNRLTKEKMNIAVRGCAIPPGI